MNGVIETMKLSSEPFGHIVWQDKPIDGLKDGCIYVMTDGDYLWEAAVKYVNREFESSRSHGMWAVPPTAASSQTAPGRDTAHRIMAIKGGNMLMPLITPGRTDKYYLVAKCTDMKILNLVASLLVVDANNIYKLSFADYVMRLSDDPRFTDLLTERTTTSSIFENLSLASLAATPMAACISFHGIAHRIMPGAAEKAYRQRVDRINMIPDLVKRHRKGDASATNELKYIFDQLSPAEMSNMLLMLTKQMKENDISTFVQNNLNREKIARKSRFCIDVYTQKNDPTANTHFKSNVYFRTYLRCIDNGKLFPVKFGDHSTQVIYTMSLIRASHHSRPDYTPLDVISNENSFKKLYNIMFDHTQKEIDARYNELILRSDNHTGRLQGYYSTIENCLTKAFKDLGENPSPFIINATTPLAILSDKISLPSELLQVKLA